MTTTDVQIKQEKLETGEEAKKEEESPAKSTETTSSSPSSPVTSEPATTVAAQTVMTGIPYLNGMIVTRPIVSQATGSPVLVVPQPFPHYMQYYRPQFTVATTTAGATTPTTNPYQALDLSTPQKAPSPEPGEVDSIPYDARNRKKSEPLVGENGVIEDKMSPPSTPCQDNGSNSGDEKKENSGDPNGGGEQFVIDSLFFAICWEHFVLVAIIKTIFISFAFKEFRFNSL